MPGLQIGIRAPLILTVRALWSESKDVSSWGASKSPGLTAGIWARAPEYTPRPQYAIVLRDLVGNPVDVVPYT